MGADQRQETEGGGINGEWETHHNYMCSACGALYDGLREVMHHKWDDHPYCLVAHVTLRDQLKVPPFNMMYPQMGRAMSLTKGACHKRKRKLGAEESAKLKTLADQGPFQCSSCKDLADSADADREQDPPSRPYIFESKEKFHIHL